MVNRCPTCTSDYCPIPSDGPLDSRIYCYGERPGWQEELRARKALRTGIQPQINCFIGDAGEEWMYTYLPLAGLDRSQVHVGNVVMCGRENNKKPTAKEIEGCAEFHMRDELSKGNPEVVILMGATACGLVEDVDLETEHGIPRRGRLWDWEGWIVPMFHPAAGLHNTSMMQPMLEDWEMLGKWRIPYVLKDIWPWPKDRFASKRDYRLVESRVQVDEYFDRYVGDRWIGIDTESHAGSPWSIQISIQPGTGILARLPGRDATAEQMMRYVQSFEPVFHNADADIDIARTYGAKFDSYQDTMRESYHLMMYRQALKILSYRRLGRKRKSWEEMVGGVSKVKLQEWMWLGLQELEDELRVLHPRVSEKTGRPMKPLLTKSPLEKDLHRIMKHTNPKTDYDPWKKLAELGEEQMRDLHWLVGRLGQWPLKGIANLPLEDAVEYGCSDADDTLCLALDFEKLRKEYHAKWDVQKEDKDPVLSQCETA